MTNKPEGVSEKTVEKCVLIMQEAIAKCPFDSTSYSQALENGFTALLASGEVVLRKDVEELRSALYAAQSWGLKNPERESDWKLRDDVARIVEQALNHFTTNHATTGETE